MRIFNILERFDEKIKLYKLHPSVIKIWRIDNFIGVIAHNDQLHFDLGYVVIPREDYTDSISYVNEYDTYMNCDWNFRHGVSFNDFDNKMFDMFEEEWVVGFDYGSIAYIDLSSLKSTGQMLFDDVPMDVKTKDVESLAENMENFIKNSRG